MDHTQKIQQLIDERGYKTFLEIGYGVGDNFLKIETKEKTAVDPALGISGFEAGNRYYVQTSDEFFNETPSNKKWDIVLIDGYHSADQVERDIVNAWKHLKKGGCIVVHDVWPTSEEMTRVPRVTKQWTGDVFRAMDGLAENYTSMFGGDPLLEMTMHKEDYGILIIEHTPDVKIETGFISDISYDDYKAKYA